MQAFVPAGHEWRLAGHTPSGDAGGSSGGQASQSIDASPPPEIEYARRLAQLRPQFEVRLIVQRSDGSRSEHTLILRIDTPIEVGYYRLGGILPFVLRQLLAG